MPFYNLTNFELIDIFEHGTDNSFDQRKFHTFISKMKNDLDGKNFSFDYYSETKFNSKIHKLKDRKNGLSLFHINIRSLNHNQNKLLLYLETLNLEFDVIVLSEIWTQNIDFSAKILNDYILMYDLPVNRKAGGIGIFVKQDLCPSVVDKYKLSTLQTNKVEDIWLKIKKQNRVFIVGGVYRHPGGDVGEFAEAMEQSLEKIKKDNKIAIVAGDFNINLVNYDKSNDTHSYLNKLLLNNFMPVILMPTRITAHTATLIDHIYVHQHICSYNVCAGNLYCDITDHLPNFILLNPSQETRNKKRPSRYPSFIR